MRKQHTDAAGLIVSSINKLISMLPARKEDVARDESEQGLRSRWNARYVREIDAEMADDVERFRSGRWAVNIKPPEKYENDDPIEAAKRLYRNIYGDLPRFTIEIPEIDDQIQYRMIVHSRQDANYLVSRIMSLTECVAEIEEQPALPIDKGKFASISRIEYKHDHLLPARHGESQDDDEPYRGLLDTLAGEWNGQTTIQMVCEPADDWTRRIARGIPIPINENRFMSGTREERLPAMVFAGMVSAAIGAWWMINTGPLTELAMSPDPITTIGRAALVVGIALPLLGLWTAATVGYGLLPHRVNASKTAQWIHDKPWAEERTSTKTERADIDPIARQGSSPGFRVSMRVVSVAEDRYTADGYHRRVVRSIRNSWHNRATGQEFIGDRIGWPRDKQFREMIERIAARKPDRNRIRRWSDKLLMRAVRQFPTNMADFELAATAHWCGRSAGGSSMISFVSEKTSEPDTKADEFVESVNDAPASATDTVDDAWDEAAVDDGAAVPEDDWDEIEVDQ